VSDVEPRMTRTPGSWLRMARLAAWASLAVLASGCSNGQLVDAGGERGAGGLAFVLLAVFFWIFIGSIFYMDRVRRRRSPEE
jgi:hypothetical protein